MWYWSIFQFCKLYHLFIYLFKHTFILFACLLIHLSTYYINMTWVIFYWMVYLLICNALADEKESFGTHKTWDIGRFICACVWIMSCNFSLDCSHSSYSMLANLFLHFFGFLLLFSFPPSSYSIYVVIFYCSNRSFFSYLFVETFLLILLCFFLLSVSFIVWLYSPNIFLLFIFFFLCFSFVFKYFCCIYFLVYLFFFHF